MKMQRNFLLLIIIVISLENAFCKPANEGFMDDFFQRFPNSPFRDKNIQLDLGPGDSSLRARNLDYFSAGNFLFNS